MTLWPMLRVSNFEHPRKMPEPKLVIDLLRSTTSRLRQPENAPWPKEVRLSGKVSRVKLKQFMKADPSIMVIPSGISISARLIQPSKACAEMAPILLGITTD